jgi:hypothetical protein
LDDCLRFRDLPGHRGHLVTHDCPLAEAHLSQKPARCAGMMDWADLGWSPLVHPLAPARVESTLMSP